MKTRFVLKDFERESFRYIEQDGLLEVTGGLVLILLGLTFDSAFYIFAVVAVVLLSNKLWALVRERYTFPRTGYVKLAETGNKVLFIYFTCIAAAFAILIYLTGELNDAYYYRRWSPALASSLLPGAFILSYAKSGSNRYLFYTVLSLLLGIYFSVLNLTGIYKGIAHYMMIMGVFLLFTGLLIFTRFIRKYARRAGEDANEQ